MRSYHLTSRSTAITRQTSRKVGELLAAGNTVLGGTASRIGSVSIRGELDMATHFIAGAFGTVAIPKKVKDLAADPRFEVL